MRATAPLQSSKKLIDSRLHDPGNRPLKSGVLAMAREGETHRRLRAAQSNQSSDHQGFVCALWAQDGGHAFIRVFANDFVAVRPRSGVEAVEKLRIRLRAVYGV